tara:strand:- start:359 stop:478 length:120 start_codon:yes stop_codon:yes gene_type:complete
MMQKQIEGKKEGYYKYDFNNSEKQIGRDLIKLKIDMAKN